MQNSERASCIARSPCPSKDIIYPILVRCSKVGFRTANGGRSEITDGDSSGSDVGCAFDVAAYFFSRDESGFKFALLHSQIRSAVVAGHHQHVAGCLFALALARTASFARIRQKSFVHSDTPTATLIRSPSFCDQPLHSAPAADLDLFFEESAGDTSTLITHQLYCDKAKTSQIAEKYA